MLNVKLPNFKTISRPVVKDSQLQATESRSEKSDGAVESQVANSKFKPASASSNSDEDRLIDNCDVPANLKDTTDGDVTMDGNANATPLSVETDQAEPSSRENSKIKTDMCPMKHEIRGSKSTTVSVQPDGKIPSSKTPQIANKTATPLSLFETENHLAQSSILKISSPSTKSVTVTEQVEKSVSEQGPPESNLQNLKSTSHLTVDALNESSDKLELFVTAKSGEFTLSNDLKRNLILRPARSLKIELTKVASSSPVRVRKSHSSENAMKTGGLSRTDFSGSPLRESQSFEPLNDPVQRNGSSVISQNDTGVAISQEARCTERKLLYNNEAFPSSSVVSQDCSPPKDALSKKRNPCRKSSDSDSDIETVRDSPTANKRAGSFFVVDTTLDRISLNDSTSTDSSPLNSSPDIFETSLVDHLKTSESVNHDRQPLTPLSAVNELKRKEPCTKDGALERDTEDCDVTVSDVTDELDDQLHIKVISHSSSDALSAIRTNYLECDGMKSSVTLVDDVIPETSDEESDEYIQKQISSFVTIRHRREAPPNRGKYIHQLETNGSRNPDST